MQKSKDDTFNWEDLRYVHQVAKEGSIAAAARKLGVNHSTVFRRLNQFEKRCAINIFVRNKNGYVLSPEGHDLLGHLEETDAQIQAISLKLLGKSKLLEGEIRITVPGSRIETMVIDWIQGFQQHHPQVHFVVESNPEKADLNRREADIAVRATMAPPDHLVGTELYRMSWQVVGSEAFLAKVGKPTSLEEALNLPWIGYCGGKPEFLAKFYLTHLADKKYALQVSNIEALAHAVSCGHGLALLPNNELDESIISMSFPEITMQSGLWLLTHPDLIQASRISAFMAYVREHASSVHF